MQRYLPLDEVRPGDLILSAEPTARSAALRALMWSPVSHASIAIHPLIWFESIGAGVGHRFIEPTFIWSHGRIRSSLKLKPGQKVIIKRPIGLFDDQESERIRHLRAKLLMQITGRFSFLNYARPEDLLCMVRLGIGGRAIADWIQHGLRNGRDTIFDGPSCAMLVAECYRELGFSLPRASKRVTPGQLWRSRLFSVVSAPIKAEELPDRPYWTEVRRDADRALEAARISYSAAAAAAALSKKGKGLFDEVHRATLKKLANSAPEMSASVLARNTAMRQTMLNDFANFQTLAVKTLTPAYRLSSSTTAKIQSLSACIEECKIRRSLPRNETCYATGWCMEKEPNDNALDVVFQA